MHADCRAPRHRSGVMPLAYPLQVTNHCGPTTRAVVPNTIHRFDHPEENQHEEESPHDRVEEGPEGSEKNRHRVNYPRYRHASTASVPTSRILHDIPPVQV